MASRGGIIPLTSTTNWSGVIEWEYVQNAATGVTTITAWVKTQKSNSNASNIDQATFAGTLSIDGNSVNFSYSSETTEVVSRKTHTVSVEHTGSGKLLNCVIDSNITATYAGGSYVLSGHKDVANEIPRIYMSSEFDAIEDVDFGQRCKISWSPKSSSYHYKMKFEFETESYTSGIISPNTTSTYTYTGFTIPMDWINLMPNAVYGVVSISLQAYSDSACTSPVGSPFAGVFTVSVPDSVVPSITECYTSIDNSLGDVDVGWNIAVSGHTQVVITAKGAGTYGSRIRSFKIQGAASATINNAYSGEVTYRTGIIRSSGDKVFIITCTDTRGRVSSEFVTSPAIKFYEYSKPSIIKFLASKVEQDGTVKAAISADWTFDSVNDKNSAYATLYYKRSSSEDWTTYNTSSSFPKNVKTVLDIEFSDAYSYNFKLVVKDTLNQQDEKDTFLSTVQVLLDFKANGDGLGIGKICEEPGLEVSMEAKFFANVYVKDQKGQMKRLDQYIESFLEPLSCIEVTLSANGWSSSAPFTQRVYVQGMTADRNYGPPFLTGLTGSEAIAEAKNALACIDGGSTETDYVVFVCYESAPTTDITVKMQGVI